jgi:hypothetical protein
MRSAPLYNIAALDAEMARAADPRYIDSAVLGRVLTIELALAATGAELAGSPLSEAA